MSVDRKQLLDLQQDMASAGARVTYTVNEQGYIDSVFIVGAKGIKKEYWDSVLAAAERMREWLHERDITMMHHERTRIGQVFRNGKWRA